MTDVPFANFIFDETIDHSTFLTRPSTGLLSQIIWYEWLSNFAFNKISDTQFFKKYPLLTFCLVVAFLIWYFK